MTEKAITVGGVEYVAHRQTNANQANTNYFKRMLALMYKSVAIELDLEEDQVAAVLFDYVQISGQVKGGTALLKRGDNDQQFRDKFKAWLVDENLFETSQALIELVNDVNKAQPDRAIAPALLPDDADPKV